MREQIEQIAREVFTDEEPLVQDLIIQYLSPCIAGKVKKGIKPQIGQSKLGGNPDLPVGMEYPVRQGQYCEFLGQLNFAQLKPFDVLDQLPEQGLLFIFCRFYGDKSDEDALITRPQTPSEFFGIYVKDLSSLEQKAMPRPLEVTRLQEYVLEFSPYFNTIHSGDPRLGEIEFELGMEFELEDRIASYFGYDGSPDCILLGNINAMVDAVQYQWNQFQNHIVHSPNNIPLFQIELFKELFSKRSKWGCEGHLNIGLPMDQLRQANFANLTYAYYS